MMTTKKGGKLKRSEIFNVRLDPVLKWAAEMAAAKDRRTLSSFAEASIERAVKGAYVARDRDGNEVTAWQVAAECWAGDEGSRLLKLMAHYPDAMTIRERRILEAIEFARPFIEDLNLAITTDAGWHVLLRYGDEALDLPAVVRDLREIQRGLQKP